MKNSIKNFVLLLIVMALFSCSSDNDSNNETTFVEENFLAGFLQATGFDQVTKVYIDDFTFELGFEFTPKVNGKITTLKVMLPDVSPSLRVTIWSKGTNTVLRTEVVNVASANTEFTFDITDLELIKNNQYAITMNTNDYFDRIRTDESEAKYPVTVGNIQIDACKLNWGANQTYPTSIILRSYTGDLSFDFLQTE